MLTTSVVAARVPRAGAGIAAWQAEPSGAASMNYGDEWLASGASALLAIPSVIVPEEFNVLINPAHADASNVRAEIARQYIYDVRFS